MAHDQEQRAALRILEGIEEGTMSAAESFGLIEEADPVLIYLIFTWIRRRYAGDNNADAVIGRLLAISDKYPTVSQMMKEGQADSMVEWFEDAYSYRELPAKEFIEIVVDKLES